MIPIIWRYLLSQYLKVLVFCVLSFIAVLLTTRLDEIAHFASLGPEMLYILWFTLHQIPYIIPIAVPISCLISSMLLMQRLSDTHELVALRAAGMSLKNIIAPILIAGACTALFNFYVISELASHSHLQSNLLKSELRSVNPLLLLHNKHLMRMKGIYFDTLGASKMGQLAQDVVIAMPNKKDNSTNLILAKTMTAGDTTFVGREMTMISKQDGHLMIENLGKTETPIHDFAHLVQNKVWTVNNDQLEMKLLLARLAEEKAAPEPTKRNIDKIYTEIGRRISVGLAAFTLTLLGCAYGMHVGRMRSYKSVFVVVGLSALYLFAFFLSKGMEHRVTAALLLLFVPQALIALLSLRTLRKINLGT